MRNLSFVLIGLFLCLYSHAQNTFPSSGNVGVGTNFPDYLLTVNGDINARGFIGGNGMYQNVLKINPIPSFDVSYFYVNTNIPAGPVYSPQIKVTGFAHGNSNKAIQLTIGWYYYEGNFNWTQWQSDLGYYKPSRIRLGVYNKGGANFIRIEIANDNIYYSNYSISATDVSNDASYLYSGWNYVEGQMPTETTSQIVTANFKEEVSIAGKLGIGVLTPTDRLEVNGRIRAKEVKVEVSGWPDYVFEPSYNKMPLAELERFIQNNGHLPEIPSAVEAETNGIELGEMNKLLLKKIEELTLHLIKQAKEIEEHKKEIRYIINKLK